MEECAICFNSNTDYITPCNHHFHKECIEKWYKVKPTCPLCRQCHLSKFRHRFWLFNIKRGTLNITNNHLIITYRLSKKSRYIMLKHIHFIYVTPYYIRFILRDEKNIYINTREGSLILSSLKYFIYKNNR